MNQQSQEVALSSEPGRRYVTLLFADLSRSTELVELMEAEQYAAVLAALRQVYQDAVLRHAGMVVRVQGDGLLAMFGYPHTRESDGRGAVSAALELHQRVRKLSAELQARLPPGRELALHSGIHAGLVLLKKGDVELGRYEVLGPVPHIAARLSDQAAAHQILVSEETLGPASRFFVTGPPQMVQVKGRATPLLVYRVDALAELTDRVGQPSRHTSSLFVGRQRELQCLAAALEQAMAGHTRCLAVSGAPGIGKTRLIEHFLSQAVQRGCRVLRGYCDSGLHAEPLQPFQHMMQTLEHVEMPGSAEAFSLMFSKLADQQPLVLFVDDWQWADDASHLVLASLRTQAARQLLVLTSTRNSAAMDAPGVADQTIELPPLNVGETAAAIASRLPGADPFVTAEISQHAQGNPLYIEELCHSAAGGELSTRAGKTASGAGWLGRLVESRVQRLPPGQREMLRVAAVIGNVVPAWLLETLTGQAADKRLMLELAQQDFLFPGEQAGTLRFKHGLTRDIIYESVGLASRQGLHLSIAQALRKRSANEPLNEALEAMAYHCSAGGDFERAARYAERAGDKALAASALDRARALYRAALAALDELPMSPELAQRWVQSVQGLGRVCVFDPVRTEVALYEKGLALALRYGDVASVAKTRHWLGYIVYGLGDAVHAIAHEEQALAEAQAAGDAKLAAQVVAALGEAHCSAAHYRQGLPLLEQAIQVKRQHRSGQHASVGLAFSLVCKAYVLGDQGHFDLAHECFAEAAACVGGVTHEIGATIHGWRSAVLLWQGRWADARLAATESGRHAEATRSLTQLSVAHAMDAYAQWKQAARPEHLQTIHEVTKWLEPRQSGLFRSLNRGWLCQGHAQMKQIKLARQQAAWALLRARHQDWLGTPMCYRALAAASAQSQPGAAARYLLLAMRAAERRGSAHEVANTQLSAAQLAGLRGDGARADTLLDLSSAAFQKMDMQWHLAQAASLRRWLGAAGRLAESAGPTEDQQHW